MLTPCRLFDACLRARSLAAAKVWTRSSRACSFLIVGSNSFSNTAALSRYEENFSGDCVGGAVRFGSDNQRSSETPSNTENILINSCSEVLVFTLTYGGNFPVQVR